MAEQMIRITSGDTVFLARLETALAPKTCEAFLTMLPYENKMIHVRWSGESCWIPLGDFDLGVPFEDATSHPAPGEILWYPGGISECELLFPYGPCSFSSKAGPLAGNHFLTIVEGKEDTATEKIARLARRRTEATGAERRADSGRGKRRGTIGHSTISTPCEMTR